MIPDRCSSRLFDLNGEDQEGQEEAEQRDHRRRS
jgi:hypothetical protein